MQVELRHRHYGKHSLVKKYKLPGKFKDYLLENHEDLSRRVIDEEKLLVYLRPSLPRSPNMILLTVTDKDGRSGTAISSPAQFRPWAKYFDAYVIDIHED